MALVDQTAGGTVRPVLAGYERLISLTVRHDFYGEGAACSDLAVEPTAATKTLLRNLRLLTKPRPTGIDILYDARKAPVLLRYLWTRRDRRRAGPNDLPRAGHGSWSRLSFTLTPRNPIFTNFTDMPFDVTPGKYCLYLSNRAARTRGGRTSLTVDASKFAEVPQSAFSPAQARIRAPKDAARVVVHGTSGRAILIAERGGDVQLDMTNEPPGLYNYEVTGADGSVKQNEFVYTGSSGSPLLLVDLFFAVPGDDAAGDGSYPIALPQSLPASIADPADLTAPEAQQAAHQYITPRDYDIEFRARETIWTYYIVLPQGSAAAQGLAIEAETPDAFDGPHADDSTGLRAYRFVAKAPRPLRSRSDVALRLRGGGNSTRILLDRLPVPSADAITPPQQPAGSNAASDIFVNL